MGVSFDICSMTLWNQVPGWPVISGYCTAVMQWSLAFQVSLRIIIVNRLKSLIVLTNFHVQISLQYFRTLNFNYFPQIRRIMSHTVLFANSLSLAVVKHIPKTENFQAGAYKYRLLMLYTTQSL